MPIYTKACDCGHSVNFYSKPDEIEQSIGHCECGQKMYRQFKINVISDDLGLQGIYNHADGKRYDSKSSYHRTLKERGFAIREDSPGKAKEYIPDKREIKSDIAQAIKQLS